ncbi:MAG: 2-oxoacid:acceptor oxidoreductase family protein [Rhodoferax sp.]
MAHRTRSRFRSNCLKFILWGGWLDICPVNIANLKNQLDECRERSYIADQSVTKRPFSGPASRSGDRARRLSVLQIIIQGRGGQGAQTAGSLLASAFHAQGRHIQSFASYGGARRGTPVNSYIRVDDKPVRVRCDIECADAILCFDASLLGGALLATAAKHTIIVVNSAHSVEHFAKTMPGRRVIPIDGLRISRQQGLGRIVNSALLGALVRAIEAPTLEVLTQVLVDDAPKQHDENIAACIEGYRCAEALMLEIAA